MTTPALTNKKFDTLDAFRFFAFLQIFFLHIPDFSNTAFNKFKSGGSIGVSFFFVLSGFLITYLLAEEKAATGIINPKRFMMRRILRIWPLYYLGVLMAYANIAISQRYGFGNNTGYMPNILYSITFTENIKMLIEDNFPNGAPLRVFWSLCVEEQFYILWVIIFRYVNLKNIAKLFLCLIIIAWCYRFSTPFFLKNINIKDVDLISNLDYFCVGGLVGLSLIVYPSVVKKIKTVMGRKIQILITCFCTLFFFFHHFFISQNINDSIFFPTITAAIFGLLITSFAFRFSEYQISNESYLGKLGKISYGLYVYHTPVILALMLTFKTFDWQYSCLHILAFILTAFIVTVIISKLSYEYFEQPFLKFRNKYFPK